MKIIRFNIFLIALALVSLSVGMFWNVSTVEAAFGISPPWIRNDHMLPGTTYEQVINLSRSDIESDMGVRVRLAGDEDLLEWIKIPNEESLIIRKGESMMPMKVLINLPKRAEIKHYRGNIAVSLIPIAQEGLGGGEVAIRLGASIAVDITVIGDKIIDYKIKSTSVDPLPEGSAFRLKVVVANLGNTEISAIEGQIDIYDKKKTEILHSLTFPSFGFPIEHDRTQSKTMLFEDTILPPGEYLIDVKILKDGEVIYEDIILQVVEEKVIPVITPEDVLGKQPALPGNGVKEPAVMPPVVVQAPVADLKPAAPAAAETSNIFLIFGLAGIGLGLVAVIGIIIVLVMVLKNQRQAAAKNQPAQSRPEQKQFQDKAEDDKLKESQ